jgi:gentisate 1,2-dioxygenase
MNRAELDRYLAERDMEGLWSREIGLVHEPIPAFGPKLWRWADIQAALYEAARCKDVEDTERLNIGLRNPTGRPKTIGMGVQIVPPGQKARPHRHTIAAIRFVIQGSSRAYTGVEGEPMALESGDLILTPNWTWHEHVNNSAEPVIWIDGVDAVLLGYFQAGFWENFPETERPMERAVSLSEHMASLSRPAWLRFSSLPGIPYRYPWSRTVETLRALKSSEGDPCDGIILNYVDALTGGPTLPTFCCSVQLLPPGTKTQTHRHTSVSHYHVIQGTGATHVGEASLQWQSRDFFVVPPWSWHSHENLGDEDAILFSMSDWPLLKPFGLYREEIEGQNVSKDRAKLFS